MVKLADTQDLGSCTEMCKGSSPFICTKESLISKLDRRFFFYDCKGIQLKYCIYQYKITERGTKMSVKHVNKYYQQICDQYSQMVAELKDFEKEAEEGLFPPEKID